MRVIFIFEEFQIVPEQSTSAIVVHHPEAKYFNIKEAANREDGEANGRGLTDSKNILWSVYG
jgi:hypothetical protein